MPPVPAVPALVPAAIATPLALCLIAIVALFVGLLFVAHIYHNRQRVRAGQPTKSTLKHVSSHAPHHVAALVVLAVGVAILLGVGVVYVIHHGGAPRMPHLHIKPRHHYKHVRGGGGTQTIADTPDWSPYFGPLDDQLSTSACCALTAARLIEMQRLLRGEHIPTLTDSPIGPYPLSGYKDYSAVTGGNMYVPTNPIDDAAAFNRPSVGAENVAYWGPSGVADALDPARTTPLSGVSAAWDFYDEGGATDAALLDLDAMLMSGPQGVVVAMHHEGDAARGVAMTQDGGAYVYNHCWTALRMVRNYHGLGPAVLFGNSYNTGYGFSGFIWFYGAALRHIIGIWSLNPGTVVKSWLPPSTPTALPTARPTPAPTRTATPPPTPGYKGVYTLAHAANLRASPSGRVTLGLPAGVRLRSLGTVSGSWVRVQLLVRGVWYRGWCPVAAVVKST